MSLRDSLEQHDSFVFRFQTFNEVKESLYGVFGASAYTIMFHAGLGAGKRSFERRVKKAKNGEYLVKTFVEEKSGQNWGQFIFNLNFATATGTVVVRDCFEARAVKSKQSTCYFVKGFLTGFLAGVMQKPVVLNEVRCIAKGDEYCEFTVTPDH